MKRMSIYEPAMCCDTGVCGVNVDPELVRISTVINNLKKNGITIERYNLSSEPMAFINNNKVKDALDKNGIDRLPLILVDDDIVIEGRYPKNEEIMEQDYLESSNQNSCCSSGNDSCCSEDEEPNQGCCGNNSSCC
ncbi:Arsenical resistance operon trans-acting repressor ArsD [Haemophilus influenzae]|uniref:Arsenical resistance operon trans-acting repressor ArsD n=1 Tax=Haemophilus influenzae TaxID=727 RepID=A0AAX3IQ33_HAEIF|nr:arsenite efflux transporter metallochaperone ArsD [Haemophilus influenzae]VTX49303.1 Arsenical resistance operon trans-acting repressor ArsD [Haemophilus influenzae]